VKQTNKDSGPLTLDPILFVKANFLISSLLDFLALKQSDTFITHHLKSKGIDLSIIIFQIMAIL